MSRVGIVVGLALTVLAFIRTAAASVHTDVYVYAVSVRLWLDGGVLYTTAWQDKPPLGLLAYVPGLLVDPHGTLGLQLTAAACVVAQAVLLLACGLGTASTRLVAAGVAVGLPFLDLHFNQLFMEQVANPCILLCLIAGEHLRRGTPTPLRWCALAGAATGAAFLIKQNALLAGAAPLAVLLWLGPTWAVRGQRLAVFTLAAVAAVAVVVIPLVGSGRMDLAGCWDTVILYPKRYATAAVPGATALMLQVVAEMPFVWLLLVALVGLARRPGGGYVLWCAVCLTLAVVAPLKPFAHYLIVLMPVFAFAMLRWSEEWPVQTTSVWRLVPLLALAFTTTALGLIALAGVGPGGEAHAQELRAVAAEVDELASVGGTLWAAGSRAEAIHFYAHARPVHSLFTHHQMSERFFVLPATPFSAAELARVYRAHPPTVIARRYNERGQPDLDPRYADDNVDQLLVGLLRDVPYRLATTQHGWRFYVRADR